jgi:hypothetical protein
MLVGDANVDVGNLVVVVYLGGLGNECVAGLGTVEEHDVVLDAEGETAVTVHDCGEGNVGEGEECSALTDAAGIEVLGGYDQFSPGVTLANLFEYATAIGGETIVA